MTNSPPQPLPDPYPTNGGPPKVPVNESLFYITGSHSEGLIRLRRFLLEDKNWSPEQVDTFLEAFDDRWPAIQYPQCPNLFGSLAIYPDLWSAVETLLSHPARETLIQAYGFNSSERWLDYGGFLHAELPAIRASYQAWWQRQLDRTKNLPQQKKIKHPPKKIA
jgi:hypothetical protein